MARLLRTEHHHAILRAGANVHRELRQCFEDSSFRRAWLIDGHLAALGGVRAPSMCAHGYVWLALTNQAARHPVAVVREAKRQLASIMVTKRELATTLIDGDDAARRFAVFLGFHVAHDGVGSPAISRAGRRTLLENLNSYEDRRVRVGNSFVTAVGYHEEAV